MISKVLGVLALLSLTSSCGVSFSTERMIQHFHKHRALYEEVATVFWDQNKLKRAYLGDMDPSDPELKDLWTEPVELRDQLSKETWKALKASGVKAIAGDTYYGGVTFTTFTSGIAISGSSRGYLIVFEKKSPELYTDDIQKKLKDPKVKEQFNLDLIQPIDDKAALFYERE